MTEFQKLAEEFRAKAAEQDAALAALPYGSAQAVKQAICLQRNTWLSAAAIATRWETGVKGMDSTLAPL